MTVYVLMGAIQYEGSSFLGVYATKAAADAAKVAAEQDEDAIVEFDEVYIIETAVQ